MNQSTFLPLQPLEEREKESGHQNVDHSRQVAQLSLVDVVLLDRNTPRESQSQTDDLSRLEPVGSAGLSWRAQRQ